MSHLPDGWARVSLASITGEASQRIPAADEQITYIDIGSVDRNSKTIVAPQRLSGADAPSRARKQVRQGDTLVSMTRPNLNAVALVPPELDGQIASTGFDVLRPLEGIDPRWIAYLVRTEAFVEAMSSLVQGALYPAVRSKDVRAYPVPLAPSAEQTRIADQLDKLLARIQACNDRLDAIPALLKRFRQAVLTAATSGALTEDWRAQRAARVARMAPSAESGNCVRDSGQLSYQVTPTPDSAALHPGYGTTLSARNEITQRLEHRRKRALPSRKFKEPVNPDISHWQVDLPDGWSLESVSAYAECLDYMRVPVTKNKRASIKGLYPYYGANGQVDLVDEYLFDDELVLVTEDETFYGREKPIAYRVSGRCWVNNHAHVLFAGNPHRADYLCYALMYYNVLPWLTGTTGRAKLTQGVLNALPIAVPPQVELEEIVRRVKTLFQLADRIEARYTAARAQARRLTPLLLAKAFRGELVPQDPDDEPAAALLERLRAQRLADPRPAGRGRKTNKV